ncbi:hypothetical protein PI124_g20000 [Phytophthora idaei]|nr:hypothetical protein PI125_g23908 [Phytophthora idaei]KAG3132854.1 hypothetical protein PI126_g19451 [Phytophthora idaei]KAG3234959.1 hypothetical protein PI124_g20000 [Phytophthora idaei]
MAALQDLRHRIYEEIMRAEHARLVRMRHYVTVKALADPEMAPWMYVWLGGTDVNILVVTRLSRASFTRLLDRFFPFYDIQLYHPKGG